MTGSQTAIEKTELKRLRGIEDAARKMLDTEYRAGTFGVPTFDVLAVVELRDALGEKPLFQARS